MYKFLINLALLTLIIVPVGIPGSVLILADSDLAKVLLIIAFPAISIALYVAICIAFARFGIKAVIPGKFPRQVDHPVYGPRRLYGTMWTAVYYFKPLYWLLLSNRLTKTLLLRGFGYTGAIDMTTYPDTWIRDLTLLKLGEGAYLANKSTLGTNLCLADGTIYVDRIEIGKNSIVGHLCMTSPGFSMGDNCELGSGSAMGIHVKLGNGVKIGPCSTVYHGARVADHVNVGSCSYIGTKAIINAQGLEIPPFTFIPPYSIINNAEDLEAILKNQNRSAQPLPVIGSLPKATAADIG